MTWRASEHFLISCLEKSFRVENSVSSSSILAYKRCQSLLFFWRRTLCCVISLVFKSLSLGDDKQWSNTWAHCQGFVAQASPFVRLDRKLSTFHACLRYLTSLLAHLSLQKSKSKKAQWRHFESKFLVKARHYKRRKCRNMCNCYVNLKGHTSVNRGSVLEKDSAFTSTSSSLVKTCGDSSHAWDIKVGRIHFLLEVPKVTMR